MAKAEVSFTVPLNIIVTVEIPEGTDEIEVDELVGEEAWTAAQDYCQTLLGDHRTIRATADLDGIGADTVTVLT